MEIQGIKRLQGRLRRMKRHGKDANGGANAGFTASYAAPVHENLDAHHPVGQAKFLEEPARTLTQEIGSAIGSTFAKTGSMTHSLVVGGLRLIRAAVLLAPVRTGHLKSSWFVRTDGGEGESGPESTEC